MTNEWDDYAEDWENDPSVLEYADKAFKELQGVVNIDGLSILDFGCGTGSLTELMYSRAISVVAIDASDEMIKRLDNKKLSNVETVSGLLTHELAVTHPFLKNKFDLIVASSVCSFLPDYEATLALLKSLLKSGGTFIQWDWLAEDENSGMGLSEKRVLDALINVGFSDSKISKPFEMTSSKGKMTVLMGRGKA